MKAAIERVFVLLPAGLAHLKPGHCCVRSIVGELGYDREPRPAVTAGDEGVGKASIHGVIKLGEAFMAGRDVGENQRFLGPLAHVRAWQDAEILKS